MRLEHRFIAFVAALAALHCGPDLDTSSGGSDVRAGTGGDGTGGDGSAAGNGGHASGGKSGSSSGGRSSGGKSGAGGSAGSNGDGAGGTSAGGGTSGGFTAPGYVNLAPPMLEALDPDGGEALDPPAPAGWTFYPIDGTQCRDGSSMGVYVRWGSVPKLLVYLEGGGACTDLGFCNYNPPNMNMAIVGTGETVLGSAAGLVPSRQQPGVYTGGALQGIFDDANEKNPYQGWSAVYVPYCTGDVHFGANPSSVVPGISTPQKFVGYSNMQKIVGHLVPTFGAKVERVVLTGASAGSFGAALNFSMVQDAFRDVRVDPILDAGLPFTDQYMFPCMQQRWREIWGFEDSLPSDCEECRAANGGGLVRLADFLMKKHPEALLAAISAQQDEVMRLFFSMGLKECAGIDTADPVGITIGQLDPTVYYPGPDYAAAIEEMKSTYGPTNRLATYELGGMNLTLHQHTFRSRFYESASGGKSIAAFVQDFLDGKVQNITP